MKIIYIHIPKTGGSSVTKFLIRNAHGVHINNASLENCNPIDTWEKDYLTGHITRQDLLSWIARNQLSLEGVKICTIIRHPFEQLRSNLNYPFVLKSRNIPIHEPWMLDVLSVDPQSANDLNSVLRKHNWLLNLQWQYLVTGSYLEETLGQIDQISIFPDISRTIAYCGAELQVYSPMVSIHRNRSRQFWINSDVFSFAPLRDLVLQEHALDVKLFSTVLFNRIVESGLGAISNIHPLDPERFLDSWVADKPAWQ